MICHQREGMKLAILVAERFAQPVQVVGVVLFTKEARLTVVPALADVSEKNGLGFLNNAGIK